MPKRVFQGKKKDLQLQQQNAMAHIARGNELPTLSAFPTDRGRHSIANPSVRPGSHSRSPHARLNTRSGSPGNPLIQGRHLSPASRAVLQDLVYPELDMKDAYRKLSDMNRLRAGGVLAHTVGRKKSDDQPGGGRLVKDYWSPDGEEMLDDSSDEDGISSDEEAERGRRADRDPADGVQGKTPGRQVKSLLAAAEEEREFMCLLLCTNAALRLLHWTAFTDHCHYRCQCCERGTQAKIPIPFRHRPGNQDHNPLGRCGEGD